MKSIDGCVVLDQLHQMLMGGGGACHQLVLYLSVHCTMCLMSGRKILVSEQVIKTKKEMVDVGAMYFMNESRINTINTIG